ncbi:hypothetical protein DRE_07693 [Drechslerella stenobrocha 248]|uniref:glutamate--tRNA ligase n=1 Tax=Drechslerella stenobrocha 248 TaxID=1043628 RepID=W7HK64_9PEZI|nr:hypothetical protein DRE_07693 [Drechslerella stenobrocha 248]
MSYVLDVSLKAPLGAVYPALIAVFAINSSVDPPAASPAIGTAYVDTDIAGPDGSAHPVVLKVENDEAVYGTRAVLEKLLSSHAAVLRGANSKTGKLEEEWIEFTTARLIGVDYRAAVKAIEELDAHLTLRTFIVGYTPSIADVAVYGALRGNAQFFSVIRKPMYINVHRWAKYMESVPAFTQAIDAAKAAVDAKKAASGDGSKKTQAGNFEIGLSNTEKGVVTRFPPEPSGYLHIGHAKAAMLNQYFSKMYKGQMIVRFDDTNPSKEKQEFQDSILEDLSLLGIKGDRVTYTSDYFQELFDYCVQMIAEGKAYCDDTVQEQMRDERFKGIASKNRDRPEAESLQIFTEEMKNATDKGRQHCVRAKISVDDPNKALRDPVIYRCNPDIPHHRTGTTWKLYPTYDFACPIVDSIEGVTHALRTTEYRDRNEQYNWMLKALNLRNVEVWDFARLNFIRTLLSKRKLTKLVEAGRVTGWDDPRFPTVRGIRRRGLTIEALREFIIAQGPSKNIVNLDWTLIWAINKKIIDPVAPRHTALLRDGLVTAQLLGTPEELAERAEEKPKHKKNPAVGVKSAYYGPQILIDQADARSFTKGEELTLMDWGNAIVEEIEKDAAGNVTALQLRLHLAGDFKKTEKKITWLATSQALADVELVDFDYLITKDKLEEDDRMEDFLTEHTEFRVDGVADANVREVKVGDVVQFERRGYYRCDVAWTEGGKAVFFCIPTGKEGGKKA